MDLMSTPSGINPPSWDQTETIYQNYLLHGGQEDIMEWYFNNADMGEGRVVPTHFSKTFVENYSERNNIFYLLIYAFKFGIAALCVTKSSGQSGISIHLFANQV